MEIAFVIAYGTKIHGVNGIMQRMDGIATKKLSIED